MTAEVRVAMWSGPRNISTAMMRAWENRPDTVVVDEPLYAAYLARTGLDHPGRDEVLAAQPTSLAEAVAGLYAPLPPGATVHYAKHMAHHLDPTEDAAWTEAFRNVQLIRDPAEVVASYVRSREACEPDDIGLLQQQWLMSRWDAAGLEVPVIDAADFLQRPGVPPALAVRLARHRLHRPDARPGRPVRATPTACGRRTGTTRCWPRPASRRTAPARSTSRRTTPRSPRPAGRRTTPCASGEADVVPTTRLRRRY